MRAHPLVLGSLAQPPNKIPDDGEEKSRYIGKLHDAHPNIQVATASHALDLAWATLNDAWCTPNLLASGIVSHCVLSTGPPLAVSLCFGRPFSRTTAMRGRGVLTSNSTVALIKC